MQFNSRIKCSQCLCKNPGCDEKNTRQISKNTTTRCRRLPLELMEQLKVRRRAIVYIGEFSCYFLSCTVVNLCELKAQKFSYIKIIPWIIKGINEHVRQADDAFGMIYYVKTMYDIQAIEMFYNQYFTISLKP